jgi:phosphatidyl-myo-inositol alpha-mannosyltransferase
MRVALVSPYSWTYPGGVTRHIESLATQLAVKGHDVRVLAPFDPDVRRTALLHRGARPQPRQLPDWLVPLGGTAGYPSNGAVSNLAGSPSAISRLRRELRNGGYDVVHLHEPVAPVVCWDALTSSPAPLVGTFHCYSEKVPPHMVALLLGARRKVNHLAVRIAVSDAAAWTGRRFYGGRYRIVPNGVELPSGGVPPARRRAPGDPLRVAFVGQAVERKGLPVLLRAFEALRAQLPAELTIVGASREEIAPMVVEPAGIRALGRVSDAERHAVLERSDLLCAPSLGGESFGMVLTEAFAAGTPVVASDIAGYRDVVHDGRDGVLVPRGDATRLAETLRDLALDPARTTRLGDMARVSAERYAWPHVADEVVAAYEDALAVPQPQSARRRAAVRIGALPADGGVRAPARRLPTLEPAPAGVPHPAMRFARRIGVAVAAAGAAGAALLALQRIGLPSIGHALVHSSPVWVLFGLALMCASMFLRAASWHAILKAALPQARPRYADAMQGTTIGVLMSATLPARLGEPSRALIVARRLGRPREYLPVVLGTLVSQTLLNVLALVILGAVMFTTIGLFAGHQAALLWYAVAPFGVLCAVLVAPALLRKGLPSRSARVGRWVAQARGSLSRVRSGLNVYRRPRLGLTAAFAQLGAWAIQWVSCYVLLVALDLDFQTDLGTAAAVLFAVNVTAVLPLMPSNLGVFQAACVAVLSYAYGVPAAQALGYGIILQAVEIATAVVMGTPALLKEGLSWREVRLRALHTSPVSLSTPSSAAKAREAEA